MIRTFIFALVFAFLALPASSSGAHLLGPILLGPSATGLAPALAPAPSGCGHGGELIFPSKTAEIPAGDQWSRQFETNYAATVIIQFSIGGSGVDFYVMTRAQHDAASNGHPATRRGVDYIRYRAGAIGEGSDAEDLDTGDYVAVFNNTSSSPVTVTSCASGTRD